MEEPNQQAIVNMLIRLLSISSPLRKTFAPSYRNSATSTRNRLPSMSAWKNYPGLAARHPTGINPH